MQITVTPDVSDKPALLALTTNGEPTAVVAVKTPDVLIVSPPALNDPSNVSFAPAPTVTVSAPEIVPNTVAVPCAVTAAP